MNYKNLITTAKRAGLTDESKMWASIDQISDLLDSIESIHPDLYWSFLRKTYGLMNNGHYGQDFAEYDVSRMHHTEEDVEYDGAYWSKAQTDELYQEMKTSIPPEYNEWDFYVALNAQYHDYAFRKKRRYPDSYETDIVDEAVVFWFNDEDWPTTTKVWDYMCLHSRPKREADD